MDADRKRIGCWSAVGVLWFLALAWSPYSRTDPNVEWEVTRYAFLRSASQLSPGYWNRDWAGVVAEGIAGTLVLCNGFVGFRPKANRAQRIATGLALFINVCYAAPCLCVFGGGFDPGLVFGFLGILSILQWGVLLSLILVQNDKGDPLRQRR